MSSSCSRLRAQGPSVETFARRQTVNNPQKYRSPLQIHGLDAGTGSEHVCSLFFRALFVSLFGGLLLFVRVSEHYPIVLLSSFSVRDSYLGFCLCFWLAGLPKPFQTRNVLVNLTDSIRFSKCFDRSLIDFLWFRWIFHCSC